MGLILQLDAIPDPRSLDEAHHRLTTGMNVNVLHRHLVLALAGAPDTIGASVEALQCTDALPTEPLAGNEKLETDLFYRY